MYDYRCAACNGSFDKLRGIHQSDDDVTCAWCGSADVQRQLSRFAAVMRGGNPTPAEATPVKTGGGCGGNCCGGSCAR